MGPRPSSESSTVQPEASMLPAAHMFSLLRAQGCSFPHDSTLLHCSQIITHDPQRHWAVWQCPYSQLTPRMRKSKVCEQIQAAQEDKQCVTTTLSRSLSFSLSMARFSPSSSRSIRRTVSPERVLNFFLQTHNQNDHLQKRQHSSSSVGVPRVPRLIQDMHHNFSQGFPLLTPYNQLKSTSLQSILKK